MSWKDQIRDFKEAVEGVKEAVGGVVPQKIRVHNYLSSHAEVEIAGNKVSIGPNQESTFDVPSFHGQTVRVKWKGQWKEIQVEITDKGRWINIKSVDGEVFLEM